MSQYKKDFPIFEHSNVSYLDSAATSQKPLCVLNAVDEYYKNYNANAHRGMYDWGIKASQAYEDARQKVANFINAQHAEEVIFTKNASEAFNLIAYSYGLGNLKQGDEIVLSITEHHSNLVPWQIIAKKCGAKLNYFYLNDDYRITNEEIEKKITEKTKIVCITQMSNVLGVINNVEFAVKCAHKVGAVVVVDAAQSVQHKKIDVQALNADFLVFSGHKMFAPMGTGVLYGKKQLLNDMPPFLMGGDMVEYVYEQETSFAPLPNKFEAGTQNIGGAVGLSAAIDYIKSIGYEDIQKIENELAHYAVEQMRKLDFLQLYLPKSGENHAGVISFNIKGVHPHDIADILNSYNVCTRAGNHCAQPLMRYLNIQATCRASFSIYNTKQDVDALINALNKAYDVFAKYLNKGN